jgi:hypothetical protein
MFALKKLIGDTILAKGYCVHVDNIDTSLFPEQGPIWDWIRKNSSEVYNQFGNSYNRIGDGVLRKISEESLHELNEIFRVTGSTQRFNQIENDAVKYARKTDTDIDSSLCSDYFLQSYSNTDDNVED